ncbi:Hypothetical Protein FCC1311_076122 [Hondaea fermentalgiana]|uniref:GRIP domain-containing protein n=1 Tax=Hondaea fermentalgiana TaxID=2315210 RepID=A0A2R5GNR9_9STRA|nr:Hypothetical Protein FCC1311_076122 [Hondaea fermentalgiana]|eukprot:GBG31388.1 Hypothetical Protein FCC1311_076122 [Hondaea fermentalgiana]
MLSAFSRLLKVEEVEVEEVDGELRVVGGDEDGHERAGASTGAGAAAGGVYAAGWEEHGGGNGPAGPATAPNEGGETTWGNNDVAANAFQHEGPGLVTNEVMTGVPSSQHQQYDVQQHWQHQNGKYHSQNGGYDHQGYQQQPNGHYFQQNQGYQYNNGAHQNNDGELQHHDPSNALGQSHLMSQNPAHLQSTQPFQDSYQDQSWSQSQSQSQSTRESGSFDAVDLGEADLGEIDLNGPALDDSQDQHPPPTQDASSLFQSQAESTASDLFESSSSNDNNADPFASPPPMSQPQQAQQYPQETISLDIQNQTSAPNQDHRQEYAGSLESSGTLVSAIPPRLQEEKQTLETEESDTKSPFSMVFGSGLSKQFRKLRELTRMQPRAPNLKHDLVRALAQGLDTLDPQHLTELDRRVRQAHSTFASKSQSMTGQTGNDLNVSLETVDLFQASPVVSHRKTCERDLGLPRSLEELRAFPSDELARMDRAVRSHWATRQRLAHSPSEQGSPSPGQGPNSSPQQSGGFLSSAFGIKPISQEETSQLLRLDEREQELKDLELALAEREANVEFAETRLRHREQEFENEVCKTMLERSAQADQELVNERNAITENAHEIASLREQLARAQRSADDAREQSNARIVSLEQALQDAQTSSQALETKCREQTSLIARLEQSLDQQQGDLFPSHGPGNDDSFTQGQGGLDEHGAKMQELEQTCQSQAKRVAELEAGELAEARSQDEAQKERVHELEGKCNVLAARLQAAERGEVQQRLEATQITISVIAAELQDLDSTQEKLDFLNKVVEHSVMETNTKASLLLLQAGLIASLRNRVATLRAIKNTPCPDTPEGTDQEPNADESSDASKSPDAEEIDLVHLVCERIAQGQSLPLSTLETLCAQTASGRRALWPSSASRVDEAISVVTKVLNAAASSASPLAAANSTTPTKVMFASSLANDENLAHRSNGDTRANADIPAPPTLEELTDLLAAKVRANGDESGTARRDFAKIARGYLHLLQEKKAFALRASTREPSPAHANGTPSGVSTSGDVDAEQGSEAALLPAAESSQSRLETGLPQSSSTPALDGLKSPTSGAAGFVDKKLAASVVAKCIERNCRRDCLDVVARVLDFDDDERRRVGLLGSGGFWDSILPDWSRGQARAAALNAGDQGFTDMLADFVNDEIHQ